MISAMNGSVVDTETSNVETLKRRAFVGAESEVWVTYGGLGASALRSSPIGPVSATTRTIDDMTLIATVDRVDTSIVWIVATATIHRSGTVARHRVGMSALIPRDTADMALHLLPERAWAELF
jgi:hypothetical protein